MSLWEVKNKLYKKDTEEDLGKIDPSEFDPETHLNDQEEKKVTAEDLWKEKEKINLRENKAVRSGAYVLGAIAFVLVALLGAYAVMRSAFSEKRVTLEVIGPTQVKSGKLLTYEINYKNDNRVELNNAILRVTYPDSFQPEDNPNFSQEGPISMTYKLDKIPAGKSGKILFNGRIYTPKGALAYLKTELAYNPSSFSSKFVSSNQLGLNVTSTPLNVEILAPQFVSSGDEVNYLIKYRNEGNEDFSGVKVKVDYPEGFTFSTSDPKPFEGNNIWYIGNIAAGQEGKIVANGKLEGEREQMKKAKVYVGASENGEFVSFNDEEVQTKISASPLAISQTVNGVQSLSANAGQILRFELNYKNTGTVGLRDVIITEVLDSPVLDYTTLQKDGGFFDADKKILTFKTPDFPELKNLEAGQSGSIRFSIQVKDVIPVASANDKNFVISSVAKIDSPDVPTPVSMNKIIAGNKMDIKLNSKLVVDVKGFHTDPNIVNDGPIPPKVSQETTYALHWIVRNVSNDVSGVKIEATLPTGTTMTGKIYPEDANITYNERSNSLVWEVGNLSAGTGILSSPKEASFQVKIKPSPEQVGRLINLIGKSTITAKDLFTGDSLKYEAEGRDTTLPEDPTLNFGYKVSN